LQGFSLLCWCSSTWYSFFFLTELVSEESILVGNVLLGILIALAIAFSTIYYTIKTDFGQKNPMIKKVNEENQLLRMKIEQQELKRRLDDLN